MTRFSEIAVFVFTVCAAAVMPLLADEGITAVVGEACLMLAMASAWNLMAGYVGLVSLGLQAYVGLGAYAAIYASNALGISPYSALFAGPVAGIALAVVTSFLLLRLRDAYFSISTWVIAEVVAMLVFIAPNLGNVTGLTLEATRDLDFDVFLKAIFWLSSGLAIATVFGMGLLMRSPTGLAMKGVRDNELAAVSIGVDVRRNRLLALVATGAVCGLAGAISYSGAMFVTVSSGFDVNWVVTMIFIVIVGGIGTIGGPVVGTLLYYGLRQLMMVGFGLSGSWHLTAMGLIAIATILLAPKGLWPTFHDSLLSKIPIGQPEPKRLIAEKNAQ
ncbi:branched-chain amino acid transport system permease protein [Rhizobium sp. SG_E_25_P2]|uniref:branched-chain amino acid ABC transporter permease n=1 Tax=Rhizobium sp. SG_E_25_P2 TaxID=2879942 RepID=UPI00247413D5|nr:branched-chain amino acid ABC transporter permease [Rhizobium sp. SG_E_25_P2]MDH6269576.1 branched-chain amino acid transport system permease protein [Rhizobium sp. SG_E_25_P2]